jgi:hypothetical protein
MTRMIERWEAGRVDRSGEHFELSVSADWQDDDRNGSPIAVVGPPHDGVVRIEVLGDRTESTAALIAKVEKEINFYLLDLNEPDSWAYAQCHCGTASNVYSDVHWSCSKGSQESLGEPLAPEFHHPAGVGGSV